MAESLILGQEYSFIDNKLTINGVEMFSATNISITESQEKTNNYGLSQYAVSRGRQKKVFELSFDLSLKDVERLLVLIPGGNLTDIPIGLVTLFMNNKTDKHLWTATGFEFTSDGIETALDDTEARRSYTGIAAMVKHVKL